MMSDPIAQAAANLDAAPSSTELLVEPANDGAQNDAAALQAKVNAAQANGETVTFATAPAVNAAVNAGFAALALNMLVNETPVVDAPVLEAGTAAPGEHGDAPVAEATTAASLSQEVTNASIAPTETIQNASEELPRESHLMLLEAKIAGFRAKLANAERVALDEFEAIVAHVRSVI
jgi:alpha-D-ribose 1-methylphosphonate 5-triphosphate synthase subunit PhnH